MRRALLAAFAALLVLPATAPAAKPIVVSLGDSLAAGYQLQADGAVTLRPGYSAAVAKGLKSRLVNFGCPGETTDSFINGGCVATAQASTPSQLARAVDFVKAKRKRIKAITISIGANNVVQCAASGAVDLDCVTAGVDKIAADVPGIYRRLRKAAGKKVKIVTLAPYNPFLAFYLRGGDYQQLAFLSNSLATGIRETLRDAASKRNVRLADGLAAFELFDLDTMVDYNGQQVPLAVANICKYAQICEPAPVGNIHPNDAGYARLAKTILKVIRAKQ